MDSHPATPFAGPIFGSEIEACVACQSKSIQRWSTKSFNYTMGRDADAFDIYKCQTCGTGFLNPPPSREYLSAIYAFSGHGLTSPVALADVLERERRFPNSGLDAERLVRVGSQLDASGVAASLDVGSGMGFITREMIRQGRQPVSINPGEYENAVFEAMNGYQPFVGMLEDFQSDQKFGLIVLSQVMEHLLVPAVVTQRLASMLAPGGVLALAVPNFRSAAVAVLGARENGCLWVPEHVNYFSAAGLEQMVSRAGLTVVKRQQLTRVRPDAISRRIPIAKGLTETAVRLAQIPAAWALNAIGRGIHLNVYARRKTA